MKYFMIIALPVFFFYCSPNNKDTTQKTNATPIVDSSITLVRKFDISDTSRIRKLSLPIGNANIKYYHFPKTWKNGNFSNVNGKDVAPTKIDAIMYNIDTVYDSLFNFTPNLSIDINPYVDFIEIFGSKSKVDIYTYVKNVIPIAYYNVDNLVFVIAKDSGKHTPNYDSNTDPFWLQYVYLLVFSENEIIRKYVIYYRDFTMYEQLGRYFYIDERNVIYAKDFKQGELDTDLLGSNIVKIGMLSKH